MKRRLYASPKFFRKHKNCILMMRRHFLKKTLFLLFCQLYDTKSTSTEISSFLKAVSVLIIICASLIFTTRRAMETEVNYSDKK